MCQHSQLCEPVLASVDDDDKDDQEEESNIDDNGGEYNDEFAFGED